MPRLHHKQTGASHSYSTLPSITARARHRVQFRVCSVHVFSTVCPTGSKAPPGTGCRVHAYATTFHSETQKHTVSWDPCVPLFDTVLSPERHEGSAVCACIDLRTSCMRAGLGPPWRPVSTPRTLRTCLVSTGTLAVQLAPLNVHGLSALRSTASCEPPARSLMRSNTLLLCASPGDATNPQNVYNCSIV